MQLPNFYNDIKDPRIRVDFEMQSFLHQSFLCNEKIEQQEICGVLVPHRYDSWVQNNAYEFKVIWVPNSHAEPTHNFRMTWDHIQEQFDLYEGEYIQNDVCGFMHTHLPGGPAHPSLADVKLAKDDMVNAVYAAGANKITVYNREGPCALFKRDISLRGAITMKRMM